jgi:hypothetical protein
VHRNPGLNLTNVLKKLPTGLDTKPYEAQVKPIIEKVSQIKRVEGQRRD